MIDASTAAAVLGTAPSRIVPVTTPDEARETVAQAAADSGAVIPWGAGTGQTYGFLPRRADVVVDLSGMNRILAVEPGDLTITVEAGATLSAVQQALAGHGQFLPLDPPDADRATIGGILATNAFGPSRPFYGTARDYLIGLTVVDAAGRFIKGGGKVVKNVTGYDVPKLHIGALGTLGVIVEATFKVAPRPETARVVLFALPAGGPDDENADAFLAQLLFRTAPSQRLIRDTGEWRILAIVFSGMMEVVDSEHAIAGELATEHGIYSIARVPRIMDRPFVDSPKFDDDLICHIAGLPAAELRRHSALASRYAKILRRLDTFPGSGQSELVVTPGSADPVEVVRDVVAFAATIEAKCAVWQAPQSVRSADSEIPIWSPLPASFPLMKRLKDALDPASTLNPGRFIGGL